MFGVFVRDVGCDDSAIWSKQRRWRVGVMTPRRGAVGVALAILRVGISAVVASAQQASAVPGLAREPVVLAAFESARASEALTIRDQIRFCETPAPPFGEKARGEILRQEFERLGLQNVRVDPAGNVLGDRPGLRPRPHLLVAAHLDTVFPPETDVQVRQEGTVLRGPGIGDNCRGLAVLVAVVRALNQGGVRTAGSVTFAANVGEEGLGNLRGVREIFGVADRKAGAARRPAPDIDRFVSIDGGGLYVATLAVGSRRYRVTYKGPGGHSFAAFGLANPANAVGRAVAKISELKVPSIPRTTFNVGRIGGGTSVNAIPAEAWFEADLRSSDPGALAALDAQFVRAVDAGAAEENARWGRPGLITVVKELVGDRPTGFLANDAPIVETVRAVGRQLGLSVPLSEGSTDANLPMSLGIPALTIGGGGRANDGHAVTESFDTADSWRGTQNAILVVVALATP
jgi:tripeptide aminopeptidase